VSLFRVAQEALRNVERHAQATHIDIRLDDTDDKLVLRITDDGVGFDVKNIELSKDRGIACRTCASASSATAVRSRSSRSRATRRWSRVFRLVSA
jgi:two-component system NarL family sensor kinase